MTTMYVSRCGCRRRHDSDVTEQWSLLSRGVYQRILDMALADMSSSSTRSTELLRLRKAGSDDATSSLHADATTSTSLRPAHLRATACDTSLTSATASGLDVCPEASVREGDGRSIRRRDVMVHADSTYGHSSHSSWRSVGGQVCRAQPLCLSTSHATHSLHQADSSQQRPGHVDRHVAPAHYDVTSQSVMTSDKTRERAVCDELHHVDAAPDSQQSTRPVNGQRSTSTSLSTYRMTVDQSGGREARVELAGCDGWAPIDKEVLVGIVERLSVSCLQPPATSSSVSPAAASGVQTDTTTSSLVEFRPPLAWTVTSAGRRTSTSGGTAGLKSGCDDYVIESGCESVPRDVVKRCSSSRPVHASVQHAPLQLSVSVLSTDPVRPPPHKTQRLGSPASRPADAAARRKLRRVHVRDTWNVPPDVTSRCDRKLSTSELTMRHHMVDVMSPDARHVWAPLEKSVVLNVLDHILVDSDAVTVPGEGSRRSRSSSRRTSGSCEQSVRRRWLKPPSLHAIGSCTYSSVSDTDCDTAGCTAMDGHPATTSAAAEASIKWKSNILLRMRREQTTVTTSASHWLSQAPNALAATGS